MLRGRRASDIDVLHMNSITSYKHTESPLPGIFSSRTGACACSACACVYTCAPARVRVLGQRSHPWQSWVTYDATH